MNCAQISIRWIHHEKHFYYDTDRDGFDALYELSEKYGPDSDKGKIVREILRRQEPEPDSIDF